jgi:anti-sigma factor RsiW
MSPERLFDYLEGNLSEIERVEIERQLAADPQLQRQLEIAREMQRRSRGSREVIGEGPNIEYPGSEQQTWSSCCDCFRVSRHG